MLTINSNLPINSQPNYNIGFGNSIVASPDITAAANAIQNSTFNPQVGGTLNFIKPTTASIGITKNASTTPVVVKQAGLGVGSNPASGVGTLNFSNSVLDTGNSGINALNEFSAGSGLTGGVTYDPATGKFTNTLSGTPTNIAGGADGGFWKSISDSFSKDPMGVLNFGLSALNSAANIYGGFKQLGLMKDALAMQQDAFNFNKQATTRNFNNNVAVINDNIRRKNVAAASQNTGLSGNALEAEANTYKKPTLETL